MKTKVYFFRLLVGILTFSIGTMVCVIYGVVVKESKATPLAECSPQINSAVEFSPDFIRLIREDTELTVRQKYETPPDGEYYIVNDIPKEFKDFETLEITASEYKENSNGEVVISTIIPTGNIYAKKKYKLEEIHINFRQIAFETKVVNGINYRFTGEFTEEDSPDRQADEPIYLKGILQKLKDGKRIAKTEAKFGVVGC